MTEGEPVDVPSFPWHNGPMRYCVLGSGSNGNSCYVECGETRLLVDAGLGPRVLAKRLRPLGVTPKEITHVLLTHEHWDHTRGLEPLTRRNPDFELLSARGTLSALRAKLSQAPIEDVARRPIRAHQPVKLGRLTVHPFRTSHDAADPLGFRLESPEATLGVATDLGVYDHAIIDALSGADALVLEANHCPHLLDTGPYPYFLKRRVAGKLGHLSNEQCRELLGRLLHSNLRHITFAHMSDKNNTPQALWATLAPLFQGPTPPSNWTLGDRRAALPPVDLSPQLTLPL